MKRIAAALVALACAGAGAASPVVPWVAKSSLNAAESQLDSSLVAAARAARDGVAPDQWPASVLTRLVPDAKEAALPVRIDGTVGLALRGAILAAGGENISEFAAYNVLTATVPVRSLLALAVRPEVRFIAPLESPISNRFEPPAAETKSRIAAAAIAARSGAVQWQGVTAHKANSAWSAGIDGSGVKVCVVSDGVDSLAARQASGDLPANVMVLANQRGSGDRGTAMLEVINDMAPGATLGFATGNGGPQQMAANMTALVSAGCSVIVDDIGYPNEPAFEDGPGSAAINTNNSRVAFVSAAGNRGNLSGGHPGVYEGDFLASTAAMPAAVAAWEPAGGVLHGFGTTPYTTLTQATSIVALQWSDPLGQSSNDYDVFVTDATGNTLLAAGMNRQAGAQDPMELAQCYGCQFPVGARIYVVKATGAARALRVDTYGGGIANGTFGATTGHNANTYAATIGAVDLRLAGTGAFTSTTPGLQAEPYSSDGPRRQLYYSNGVLQYGSALLANYGGPLGKVNALAGDCGTTTTPGYELFCGTSAAAATAAGVAALVRQANPRWDGGTVARMIGSNAIDVAPQGYDVTNGNGVLMASSAVASALGYLGISTAVAPSRIYLGEEGSVSVRVTNTNDVALTNVRVTVDLPGGVLIGSSFGTSALGTGCSAHVQAASGDQHYEATGIALPAHGTCILTFNVRPSSSGNFGIQAYYYLPTDLSQWQGGSAPAQLGVGGSAADGNIAPADTSFVIASSTFGSGFPAQSVIDGDTTGRNWTAGGGWADATLDQYPDWIVLQLNGKHVLDAVSVYTLQDNWQSPVTPTSTMTFTQYGIVDFTVDGWDGTRWATLATVTGNNLVQRTVTFAPYTTDRIRVNVTRALGSVSRITEVAAMGYRLSRQSTNVAAAAAGGVAFASSVLNASYPVEAVNDGERAGAAWSNGGGWADGTIATFPDWLVVRFNHLSSIDRVVVYTVQDDWQHPVEPDDALTFTQYGLVDFDVEVWDGAAWNAVAQVRGNNLVKRTVTFNPVATDRVRINVLSGLGSLSRVTEVEAWGIPMDAPVNTNLFQLVGSQSVATASSTLSAAFAASGVVDGDRTGRKWGNGGGWADGTLDAFPDSIDVTLSSGLYGTHYITSVVVYSVQDNWQAPVEPGETMPFTKYGIVDFTVDIGHDNVSFGGPTSWTRVATVQGNDLVRRKVDFAGVYGEKVRITVQKALGSLSRITEIEAWGNP